MPRQLSCRDLCKFVTWLNNWHHNDSKKRIFKISIMSSKNCVKIRSPRCCLCWLFVTQQCSSGYFSAGEPGPLPSCLNNPSLGFPTWRFTLDLSTLRSRQNGRHLADDILKWMKIIVYWFKCHWSLFLRIQLIITQHWLTKRRGNEQAISYYLNQLCSSLMSHIFELQ